MTTKTFKTGAHKHYNAAKFKTLRVLAVGVVVNLSTRRAKKHKEV